MWDRHLAQEQDLARPPPAPGAATVTGPQPRGWPSVCQHLRLRVPGGSSSGGEAQRWLARRGCPAGESALRGGCAQLRAPRSGRRAAALFLSRACKHSRQHTGGQAVRAACGAAAQPRGLHPAAATLPAAVLSGGRNTAAPACCQVPQPGPPPATQVASIERALQRQS